MRKYFCPHFPMFVTGSVVVAIVGPIPCVGCCFHLATASALNSLLVNGPFFLDSRVMYPRETTMITKAGPNVSIPVT